MMEFCLLTKWLSQSVCNGFTFPPKSLFITLSFAVFQKPFLWLFLFSQVGED